MCIYFYSNVQKQRTDLMETSYAHLLLAANTDIVLYMYLSHLPWPLLPIQSM